MDKIVVNVGDEGRGEAVWNRYDEEEKVVDSGGPFPTKEAALADIQQKNPDPVPVEIVLGPAYEEPAAEASAEGPDVTIQAPAAEGGAGGTE